MTQLLKLFGFGSYFRHKVLAEDIDLLIVHRDVSSQSIQFALYWKSLIKADIPKAHIVVLSEQEERELNFVGRSGAVLLEILSDSDAGMKVMARKL